MLMFNKSPWLSMGTIIRYPQREIEKLIILSIFILLWSVGNGSKSCGVSLSQAVQTQSICCQRCCVACAGETIASIQLLTDYLYAGIYPSVSQHYKPDASDDDSRNVSPRPDTDALSMCRIAENIMYVCTHEDTPRIM